MRSIQSRTIQQRAKRRVLATAIFAVAFAGYGAISLLADDLNAVTKTVAEINKVPAVRSVGIRLINPSGSATERSENQERLLPNGMAGKTGADNPNAVQTTQHLGQPAFPAPIAMVPAPGGMVPAPGGMVPAPGGMVPAPGGMLPAPGGMLPAPGASFPEPRSTPNATRSMTIAPAGQNLPPISAAGRMELPPPPPMAELLNQNTNGRVLVKLASDKAPPNSGSTSAPVVPQLPSGYTKAQLSDKPHSSAASPEIATVANLEPIRVSFDDNAAPEAPSDRSNAPAAASLAKNRLPEQIKPKPTKIAHTVSLAESTEIELPPPETQSNEAATKSASAAVVVKAQLASHSLGKDATDARSSAKASPEGFVALAPPSLSELGTGTSEVKKSGGATPAMKLDSHWAKGTPSTTIELESRTAKAVDIPAGIKSITIENEDVCRVLHDVRTMSLVGNQPGSTLVQIWTNESKETPTVVRVNVSQPWQKSNSKPTDVPDVKLAVAQAFPNANIDVFTNADGTLEVRGTTDSEDSAIRILEIVRKVCLVPVKDKVTVSR